MYIYADICMHLFIPERCTNLQHIFPCTTIFENRPCLGTGAAIATQNIHWSLPTTCKLMLCFLSTGRWDGSCQEIHLNVCRNDRPVLVVGPHGLVIHAEAGSDVGIEPVDADVSQDLVLGKTLVQVPITVTPGPELLHNVCQQS